jgi:uncharacterized protein (DUF1800 family)
MAKFGIAATLLAALLANGAQAATSPADAHRLLRQATFGPTPAEVQRVAAMGPEAWLDEQLSLPATRLPDYPWIPANRPTTCVDDRTPPLRADSYCARDNYTLFPLQVQFFRNAIAAPDQLRQRVAFALAQVFVTSGVHNARNYAMARYQQLLADHAFGTYRELLRAVTLSPEMGDYLDMANNNKANPATRTEPNENYAREVLQLFSIGTWLLEQDGSLRRGGAGQPIPAYDQEAVEGFAHVFTGWTYAPVPGAAARNNNPRNFEGTLQPVAANHDTASKELLNGTMTRANLAPAADLDFALANIAAHSNVGPFIGTQLIRKLVTSDPSPAYVARVSAVFADNGHGVRGDLKAVVRAILLDPEAREPLPDAGKLAEPVLYLAGMARALGAATDGVYFRTQAATLSQNVFYAPSVFNHYPAAYEVPGLGRPGPEFALLTSATTIARANAANTLLYGTINPDASVFGATGTQVDLGRYTAVARDAGALLDRLDLDLLGGTMPTAMRAAILVAIQALPATDVAGRARAGLYLVFTSPQYQVQR